MQIYKITNKINGKIYIGKDERSRAQYYGSGLLIGRAIALYGKQFFIKDIIEEVENREELCNREIYWITYYRSTDRQVGYNITKGGDGGDTLTDHPDLINIRKKISKKTVDRVFTEQHLSNLKRKHPRLKLKDKNMDYDKWLSNIREAHSRRKGKILEEIVGRDKAALIKDHLKKKRSERSLDFNKPVEQYDKQGTLMNRYDSQQQASEKTGVRQGDISNCITGRQKTAKGYIWKLCIDSK